MTKRVMLCQLILKNAPGATRFAMRFCQFLVAGTATKSADNLCRRLAKTAGCPTSKGTHFRDQEVEPANLRGHLTPIGLGNF